MRALRAGAGALTFLTRIPLGRPALDATDVVRGVVVFPLVGALVGAGMGLVATGLEGPLTPLLAATAAVGFEAVVTGAIHLDGLADAADGLGARSRTRALEVMREGTIGAFGATALVLDLLLKTGAIAALLAAEHAALAIAAGAALGRATPLALAWALPYARPGEGSGRILTDGAGRWRLAGGLVLACVLAAALLGRDVLPLLAGAGCALVVVAVVARRRFGGVTGDVLGAVVELATTGALLGAAAGN